MATTEAVSAVCETIARLLTTSATEDGLDIPNVSFQVYSSQDFTATDRRVRSGASIFLYRVLPNLSHRTPAGRLLSNGTRQIHRLPLDLHLIVTIWGNTADTQARLVGWVLRTLEDYPVIPASTLNGGRAGVFQEEDESVELLLSEIDSEELLQLWDVLGNGDLQYQVSIPYLVRNVQIDSQRVREAGEPVQVRTADMQRLQGGGS
jgi:hypothetical protein